MEVSKSHIFIKSSCWAEIAEKGAIPDSYEISHCPITSLVTSSYVLLRPLLRPITSYYVLSYVLVILCMLSGAGVIKFTKQMEQEAAILKQYLEPLT